MSLDILLVNPNSKVSAYGPLADDLSAIEPPFWAGLMADDFRKRGQSVAILDAEAEELDFAQTVTHIRGAGAAQTILVAMGVNPSASSTPKMRVVERIAAAVPCLITGLHPMALPDMRIGGCNQTLMWHPTPNLSVPWDLLPMDKYRAHNWHCFGTERQPYAVVYTSLGCPYHCTYCNIHTLYNSSKVQYRPVEDVLAEIDLLYDKYGMRNIKVMDELFTLNKERIYQICDALIERDYGLNIWAYARVGTVDTRMLAKMKKAGINWLGIGFESAVPYVRKPIGKNYETKQESDTILMIKDAGINIAANFIFGLPDDSRETMMMTLFDAQMCDFEWVNFYCLSAYPGSELYKQQANPSQDWNTYSQLGYDFEPLPTKYLTSKEVLAFRDKAFVEYYSRPEYLQMMQKKFGDQAVIDIQRMLDSKIERKLLR